MQLNVLQQRGDILQILVEPPFHPGRSLTKVDEDVRVILVLHKLLSNIALTHTTYALVSLLCPVGRNVVATEHLCVKVLTNEKYLHCYCSHYIVSIDLAHEL